MLRDSRSYEVQIIDAVRAVNKALGGTYGISSAIGKTEFNQFEVQLVDAIRGIGRTLSGHGFSLAGGGGEVASNEALLALSKRVSKLESESFFRLVDGNVTLKTEYQNLWVPGWLAAGGIGNGSGGGVSYLRELEDVYHSAGTNVLRSDGTTAQPGDALVYSGEEWGWVAAPQSGSVTGVVKKIACGSYNNLTPDSNGLVSITEAVTSLFNGWATENISIYRNYNPPQGEGTAIATITIGTAAPVVIKAPTSGGSGGATTLGDLYDVTISSPDPGHALVYRNGGWHNEAITPGSGLYLGDLENVSLLSPSNGQALIYRNGSWVNETIQGGGGGGYVGYTETTASPGPLNLYGIPYINATNVASSPSRIVWNAGLEAWHFYGNIYADGWVAAGGIGSGGGGGGSYYAGTGINIDSSNYISLKTASTSQLGGVKVDGTTITISNGVISASGGGGGGTVTSVAMTVPTGLSVSGTPITSSGTLAVSLASGYVIPQQATLDNFVTLNTPQEISGAKTFKDNDVTFTASSGLSLNQYSHIDIGPLRIKFENNALHITKKSSSDTNNYGIYADGFVAAGGIQ